MIRSSTIKNSLIGKSKLFLNKPSGELANFCELLAKGLNESLAYLNIKKFDSNKIYNFDPVISEIHSQSNLKYYEVAHLVHYVIGKGLV